MNIKLIFIIVVIGVIAGILTVHSYNETTITQEPVSVNESPYENSIYARCVVDLPSSNVQTVSSQPLLIARCFVNEILVPDLPINSKFEATLFLRGGNFQGLPLEFVKIEPPIGLDPELANGTKALPVIFRFLKPANYNIFPGQTVDAYIKGS